MVVINVPRRYLIQFDDYRPMRSHLRTRIRGEGSRPDRAWSRDAGHVSGTYI